MDSDSNVKSERLTVNLPPSICEKVRAMAKRLEMSESQAGRLLIIEGLKAIEQPGHPFRTPGENKPG